MPLVSNDVWNANRQFSLSHSIPAVQYENSATNPEYNAHYIDSYSQPKLFIAADIPTPESAARFWQMVWDQGCSYIIMLTPLDTEVAMGTELGPQNVLHKA